MCPPTLSPRRRLPPVTATCRRPALPNTGRRLVHLNTLRRLLFPNTLRRLVLPYTGHRLVNPNTLRRLTLPNTDHRLVNPNTLRLTLPNTGHRLVHPKKLRLTLPSTGRRLVHNTSHPVPKNVRLRSYASRFKRRVDTFYHWYPVGLVIRPFDSRQNARQWPRGRAQRFAAGRLKLGCELCRPRGDDQLGPRVTVHAAWRRIGSGVHQMRLSYALGKADGDERAART
jgi:hypothetical protein